MFLSYYKTTLCATITFHTIWIIVQHLLCTIINKEMIKFKNLKSPHYECQITTIELYHAFVIAGNNCDS